MTIDVHNKDIIEELKKSNIKNLNDFGWIS